MAPFWLLLVCILTRVFIRIYKIQSSTGASAAANSNNNNPLPIVLPDDRTNMLTTDTLTPGVTFWVGGTGNSSAPISTTDRNSADGFSTADARTPRGSSDERRAESETKEATVYIDDGRESTTSRKRKSQQQLVSELLVVEDVEDMPSTSTSQPSIAQDVHG